jgi:hypothetical protein
MIRFTETLWTVRRFDRVIRYTIVGILGPFLIFGAISSYRAYVQVRRLDLHVPGQILQPDSLIQAEAVCSGRVPVTLSIELVQRTQTESLAAKVVPPSREPFFDPRTVRGELSVLLTPGMLERFAPGPALVRATARGRQQWMREPPPLVREVPVVIYDR